MEIGAADIGKSVGGGKERESGGEEDTSAASVGEKRDSRAKGSRRRDPCRKVKSVRVRGSCANANSH